LPVNLVTFRLDAMLEVENNQ